MKKRKMSNPFGGDGENQLAIPDSNPFGEDVTGQKLNDPGLPDYSDGRPQPPILANYIRKVSE